MSDWSSFEGDKEFTDAWRAFLDEADPTAGRIELNEGFMSKVGSGLKKAGSGLKKGASMGRSGASKIRGIPARGTAAARALKLARGISFARAASGASGPAAPAAGETPAAAPASEAYQKVAHFLGRFGGGEDVQDLPAGTFENRKELYKSMTPDEQKKIAAKAANPNWPKARQNKVRTILGIPRNISVVGRGKTIPKEDAPDKTRAQRRSKPATNKGDKKKKAGGTKGFPPRSKFGEQLDLSLEDLIKEELLRVINEEE